MKYCHYPGMHKNISFDIFYIRKKKILICLNSQLYEQCDKKKKKSGYFQALKSSLLSNNESEKCSAFKWKRCLIMYD